MASGNHRAVAGQRPARPGNRYNPAHVDRTENPPAVHDRADVAGDGQFLRQGPRWRHPAPARPGGVCLRQPLCRQLRGHPVGGPGDVPPADRGG
ncbi:hypothetical protein G6F65_023110 [Rhizopus arrhizus]|nr:hypothetical protein G6F65_023110 [Rhizopus arrhizus]